MEQNMEMNEARREIIFTFRFGSTSDKSLRLSQQQLDCIPYLSALVGQKDELSSTRNENNEWTLNPPIFYDRLIVIFHSVTAGQPYVLFDKLSEDETILDILKLFDYLGVKSFPLTLLKDENLKSVKQDNGSRQIEYYRASLSETRNTAAKFLLALSKNEYDLHDLHTISCIFSLIMVIFTNSNVFSSRFRHHTLTIVKEYCWEFFSQTQQNQFPTRQQIAQNSRVDSWTYLCSDNQQLPENFENTFTWKDDSLLMKEIDTNCFGPHCRNMLIVDRSCVSKSALIQTFCCLNFYFRLLHCKRISHSSMISNHCNDQTAYVNEAQSARSGRFNTLPKRPSIDKFKHRSGSKAQKYR